MSAQQPADEIERKAGVEDIFHHDDIAPFHGLIGIFGDANFATALGRLAVTGQADEIKSRADGEGASQICHENGGALEHAQQNYRVAGKIVADLRGELSDARGNLLAGEHHTQAGILRHADTVKAVDALPQIGGGLYNDGPEKIPMALPEFKQLCDEAKKEIREIDSAELRRMQQARQDFALIDVREPDEVSRGTIPGAVPIPRGVLELNIDQVTTDKNKNIVLYCGGGSRSALAAQSLKKMGFKNVISLAGGYRGWSQS